MLSFVVSFRAFVVGCVLVVCCCVFLFVVRSCVCTMDVDVVLCVAWWLLFVGAGSLWFGVVVHCCLLFMCYSLLLFVVWRRWAFAFGCALCVVRC